MANSSPGTVFKSFKAFLLLLCLALSCIVVVVVLFDPVNVQKTRTRPPEDVKDQEKLSTGVMDRTNMPAAPLGFTVGSSSTAAKVHGGSTGETLSSPPQKLEGRGSTMSVVAANGSYRGLHPVHWTSIYGKSENDSYHFFSAYYDDRAPAPELPAVLVMGYAYKKVPVVKLYCEFKFGNGTRTCLKRPAVRRHPSSCFTPSLGAKPFHYFCGMKTGDEPPLTVRLSTDDGCAPLFTSSEIPVKNRNHASKPSKRFGVCVGGPIIQENRGILQELVEFIEMSQLLGAEVIVLYVNETQVDTDILEYIWTRYPDTVRTIGWKKLGKWSPLHYFGQVLIISDCYHRLTYEVEYLVMIDVDEMILPVKHMDWSGMVQAFGKGDSFSTFKFQNSFFDSTDHSKPQKLNNCSNLTVAKYFTKTRRHNCFPGYQYRTKLITKPKYIVEPSIHYICRRVQGHTATYNVPTELAFLGHYRGTVPNDCIKKPTFVDTTAAKFKDELTKRMCML